MDINLPQVPRRVNSALARNDELWNRLDYKGVKGKELYKKWKNVMLQKGIIRQIWAAGIKKNKDHLKLLAEQNPFEQYCICRRPYIKDEAMFECSLCLNWYYDCTGFLGNQEEAEGIEEFVCPECYERQSEQRQLSLQ